MMTRVQYLLTLCMAAIFYGCDMPRYKSPDQNKTSSYGYFYTYKYDSCEYVGSSLSNKNAIFAHKGNCKFCAERRKK